MTISLEIDDIGIKEVDSISLNREGGYRDLSVNEQTSKKREDARRAVALLVVSSLLTIVVSSFVLLWQIKVSSVDDLVKVISALTAPVVGIVGAVTGFYFGESQKSSLTPSEHSSEPK